MGGTATPRWESSSTARRYKYNNLADSLSLFLSPSRTKDATRGSWPYHLGARTLLGAPGLTTRSKDATRGSWPYHLGARTLLGAPGLTTRSKDATRGSWPYY